MFRFSDGSTETRAHFAVEKMQKIAGPSKIGKFQVKQRAYSAGRPIPQDIADAHWQIGVDSLISQLKNLPQ